MATETDKIINDVKRSVGSISTTSYGHDMLRGFNRKNNSIAVPINIENQGITLFTKPALNLTEGNTAMAGTLQYMNNPDSRSSGCAIKCMLMPDPVVMGLVPTTDGYALEDPRSEIVDDRQAFIPIMSSTLKSISGWPDKVIDFFLYDEGIAKEVTGHVDSRPDIFNSFDLTATFGSAEGNFVPSLIAGWYDYMTHVAVGTMTPFPVFITEREIDYNTRIYRIVTDSNNQFITQLACTGASIPGIGTTASSFNFNEENVMNMENGELSVPFKCFGALYNDPIIVKMFNETVVQFNPDMSDAKRDGSMAKLSRVELITSSFLHSYPRISDINELEWWIPIEVYNQEFGDI